MWLWVLKRMVVIWFIFVDFINVFDCNLIYLFEVGFESISCIFVLIVLVLLFRLSCLILLLKFDVRVASINGVVEWVLIMFIGNDSYVVFCFFFCNGVIGCKWM